MKSDKASLEAEQTEFTREEIAMYMLSGAAYGGVVLAVCIGFILFLRLFALILPEDPYAAAPAATELAELAMRSLA
ncbi:MAG: RC-LH1 core complex protein PufX [Pseudomonadota bacterium]